MYRTPRSPRTALPVALVLIVALASARALPAQGPIDGYLKSRGQADIAVGVSAAGADRFRGGDGTSYDFPYRGTVVGGFVAYGLTDGLDVVASIPFVITDSVAALQDGAVFAKGRLLTVPLAEDGSRSLDVLGALGIQLPLSRYAVDATGAIGQRAQVVQPRLVAQYNQPGFFASTVLGYNYRFDELDGDRLAAIQETRPAYQPNQPSDYVTALLRLGVPTERIYVDAWVEFQRTLSGRDFVPGVEELVQPYDVDYQQVGGTVYYTEGGRWGFAASGATFLESRNTSQLWRLTGSVIFKIEPR